MNSLGLHEKHGNPTRSSRNLGFSPHTAPFAVESEGWGGKERPAEGRGSVRSVVSVSIWIATLLVAACGTANERTQGLTGGTHGVVAAATPEATAAGVAILEAGGNAVDAAVAVQFALAVTEPAMSGLGGGSQMLIHRPDTQPVVVNGTSYSPHATPGSTTADDIRGHRATTIPTTVRTMAYAWEHFGSGNVSWSQLLEAAIGFAEDGFVVGPFRHKVWQRHVDQLRADPVVAALFLTEREDVPAEGSIFRQPVLAGTLSRLAEHGAEDFYTGTIAREIASDMAANGGWITLDDLRDLPDPRVLQPLQGSYRGWDVYTSTPPGSGWVVLQILNVLERSAPSQLALDSPERIATLAAALHIGHSSRRATPITDLIDYQQEAGERIEKGTAVRLLEERESGETTHFTVVDGEGMTVAVTSSINAYFGARAAHETLGFLYNDYMHEFVFGLSEHPFAIRPNGMPLSSMSPTVLARDGRPVLALGSPGSARIISAVTQVVQLWVDEGLPIDEAVTMPRIHALPGQRLYMEARRMPGAVRRTMEQAGYTFPDLRWDLSLNGLNAYFGGVHAVAFDGRTWRGAADPRRDGAVGYARK